MTTSITAKHCFRNTGHVDHIESFVCCSNNNNVHLLRWLLPLLSTFFLLFASHASAQENMVELNENLRKIFIDPIGATSRTVEVGQTLTGPLVTRRTQSQPDLSYILWEITPASAARINQPSAIEPAGGSVEIEFLQAATVTIKVSGYDQREDADESNLSGFNEVEFTFTVIDPTNPQTNSQTNSPSSIPTLNDNQQSTQAALEQACNTSISNATNANTAGQNNLNDTCQTIALQNDPALSLDRLTPEELFAMGDALTISADQQISNIQSRIYAVRARQRQTFEIKGLSLTLWDQAISGTVLSAAKDALFGLSGGGASQDAIQESAFGLFVSGNVSMGDVDGQSVQRDAKISSNSLTLGADYRVSENSVFGAALGIVNDKTDFTGDNGDLDMQGQSISAFATWYEHDKGYADAIIEFSQNNFDLKRRINLPGQASEFANSSTDATRMALSINVGRTFHRGATEFGPVGRIAVTRASIDGFRETSSNADNGVGTELDIESHSLSSIRLSIGAEVKHAVSISKGVLVPTAKLELEMETETDKGAITATFVNDPDKHAMKFNGTRRSRSAMWMSIGSTAVLKNGQSAFISFETRASDEHLSQTRVRLGYRMQF